MPGVARRKGVDKVNTVHNSIGSQCDVAPKIIGTAEGSSDVIVEGTGVVRVGDAVEIHDQPGCIPHAPNLVVGSNTVFANGKPIGRLGDTYGGTEQIITGATTVNAG